MRIPPAIPVTITPALLAVVLSHLWKMLPIKDMH